MNKITYLCLAIMLCTMFSSFAQSDGTTPSGTATIQRVRLGFKAPQGYTRHLLLAFTSNNNATDAIDYGYDARNFDNYPDDLNWMIDSQRFVIQGVGQYDNTKIYPFGMFMTNSGSIEIALTGLENFSEAIDVFIYDSLENTYTPINDTCYSKNIESGIYENRFYIAFSNGTDNSLSVEEPDFDNVSINYFARNKSLKINSTGMPLQLKLYNLQGQLINAQKLATDSSVHNIPIDYLQTQVVLVVLESEGNVMHKRIIIN